MGAIRPFGEVWLVARGKMLKIFLVIFVVVVQRVARLRRFAR
jgi:hypothetical protein